jgi:hypothetical protein
VSAERGAWGLFTLSYPIQAGSNAFGRLGLAAPQVPLGRPRRGEWRQDPQASDRDYLRSNPTEGRTGRPTCGSLHLEVLRRGLPLVCNLFVLDLLTLVEGRQTALSTAEIRRTF